MRRQDGSYAEDIQCIIDPVHNRGGIFISNIEAASNPQTLARHNIGAVITACKGKNMSNTMPKHIEYLYLPAIDHESFDLSVYFKDAIELLQEETSRTNVLVHCMAGVSRSATLVIAYLMKNRQIGFNRAFEIVKSRRRIIHPNDSFLKQLQQFERTLNQQPKKHMEDSTSSSWFSRSASKPPSSDLDYDRQLKAQIRQLIIAKTPLKNPIK